MGATSWSCFTPYQENVGIALRRLRHEVFEQGEHRPPPAVRRHAERTAHLREAVASLAEHGRGQDRGHDVDLAEQGRGQDRGRGVDLAEPDPIAPESIEELLEACGEAGTHSVLDIGKVSERPEGGSACPAPESVLLALYGTPRPTRPVVEAVPSVELERAAGLVDGQAVWLIVFSHDEPDEYYFAGRSGT